MIYEYSSILAAYSPLGLQKARSFDITTKRKVNDYVILLARKITKTFVSLIKFEVLMATT